LWTTCIFQPIHLNMNLDLWVICLSWLDKHLQRWLQTAGLASTSNLIGWRIQHVMWTCVAHRKLRQSFQSKNCADLLLRTSFISGDGKTSRRRFSEKYWSFKLQHVPTETCNQRGKDTPCNQSSWIASVLDTGGPGQVLPWQQCGCDRLQSPGIYRPPMVRYTWLIVRVVTE